ncbi:hypothetical protein ACODYM_29015 [Burkholderia gladioli]|uniref:hypothetical protein n=1 Tax=Burkholderia gladioli TaxID=28095 RepID=UPI003B500A3F
MKRALLILLLVCAGHAHADERQRLLHDCYVREPAGVDCDDLDPVELEAVIDAADGQD